MGYYIFDKIQFVSGFNYSLSKNKKTQNNLIFNPGVTIEKANNFILVMQVPYQLYGDSPKKSIGFGLALTIIID